MKTRQKQSWEAAVLEKPKKGATRENEKKFKRHSKFKAGWDLERIVYFLRDSSGWRRNRFLKDKICIHSKESFWENQKSFFMQRMSNFEIKVSE